MIETRRKTQMDQGTWLVGEAPVETRNSNLAIASFIAGFSAWTILPLLGVIITLLSGSIQAIFSPFAWPFLSAFLAILLGHMGKAEAEVRMMDGKSLATAGMVMGYLFFGVSALSGLAIALIQRI
ncbi:MAG: hypothetical protein GTO18_14550 [Anaerolineales bacterium]|nr:hypothetical protein [Anaerolineales bacterium]